MRKPLPTRLQIPGDSPSDAAQPASSSSSRAQLPEEQSCAQHATSAQLPQSSAESEPESDLPLVTQSLAGSQAPPNLAALQVSETSNFENCCSQGRL